MQYIKKVNSLKKSSQKIILKENDQIYYMSLTSATKKANFEEKELWQCEQNGNIFYIFKDAS